MRTSLLSIVAAGTLAFSGASFAQSLTVSDETGQAGTTVTVDVDYTGNATSRGGNFELEIADPTLFSSISIECGEADQVSGDFTNNCVFNAPDTFAIGLLNQSDPLPSGNIARLIFTIDAAATVGDLTGIVEGTVNSWEDGMTITAGSVEVSSGPTPDISLTGNGAFGGVEAGDSANSTFTVENSGDPSTTLEINSIDVTGDAEFSQNGGTCTTSTTLATGETCTVIVEFAPGATGNFNGDIAVGSNAGSANIALTGQGTAAQPDLNTTSTSLVLQGEEEGQNVSGSFTVSNDGTAATEIVVSNCSITTDPSGTAAIAPAGATLAGGDAQQFTVSADSPAIGANYTVEFSCDFEEFDSDGTSIGTGTIDGSAAVSTRPAVIPTLSAAGMILFAMLMGLIGLVVVRQRA